MLRTDYFKALRERLDWVESSQGEALSKAASMILEAVERRHRTFLFGSGHSNLLVQEVCMRAGGLPFFNPLFVAGLQPTDYPYLRCGFFERVPGLASAVLDTAPLKAGEVLIVISNSGRNCVPIEMAMEARERGIKTIALTSVAFSGSQPSRHPSGKHLMDVVDLVIDNGCPPGDGTVAVSGTPARVGPLSTVIGGALLNALVCEVTDQMLAIGQKPPVLMSGNADGWEEHYEEAVRNYQDLMTYTL